MVILIRFFKSRSRRDRRYEVTQLGPIVHPPGFGENDVAFAINYRVTDANGDFIDGCCRSMWTTTRRLRSGQRQCNRGHFAGGCGVCVLSNDVAGADGFTAGGGVVGVRAAGGDLMTDVTTGVNTPIPGLHGTLILQEDGGYIYKSIANNIKADTTDVFVYAVTDSDGDLSTTTLTINLANVTVSVEDTDALVNEAGLPIVGSNAASDSEFQRFDHAIWGHRPVHLFADQPSDRQPRHAAAERRDRHLHLYADLSI